MNRWDRYARIVEGSDGVVTLVNEAVEYHKDNQSALVQSELWDKVARAARELADLVDVEVCDPTSLRMTKSEPGQ